MKLYKNTTTNEIFAYELDGSQDRFISNDLLQISDKEADEIRKTKTKAAFDALPYSQKRISEYPPITDYIDGVVKNDQDQIDKYIAACLAVKAKYPKE